jgi:hypothetical protein
MGSSWGFLGSSWDYWDYWDYWLGFGRVTGGEKEARDGAYF